MHNYAQQLLDLASRLRANPRVEVFADDLAFLPKLATSTYDVNPLVALFQQDYGFSLAPESWQLLKFPKVIDLAWSSVAVPSDPLLHRVYGGSINLNSPSASLSYRALQLGPSPHWEDGEHSSHFDNWSHSDVRLPVLLRYNREYRRFWDLSVFLRPDIVPIELDLDSYLPTALAWYGAYPWQALYLPLDFFANMFAPLRAAAYRLPHLLPRLFPDADWSILATKQAYFDLEAEDRRRGYLTGPL